MGLLRSVSEALRASGQSTNRGEGAGEVEGAYWCHDCGERVADASADDETPDCPDCGDAMAFERSPGSTGCAC
ncbi:hypothetical protein [Halosegnis marinus]|uniref:RING-type E3 ubiquitin transferase n=1 Tax=Halosegnis marinus TaxID=3034023 RepID=A0ABD5ZNU7_9EURY|nr:hypothetical protein [Halosegnis sp. DT85]